MLLWLEKKYLNPAMLFQFQLHDYHFASFFNCIMYLGSKFSKVRSRSCLWINHKFTQFGIDFVVFQRRRVSGISATFQISHTASDTTQFFTVSRKNHLLSRYAHFAQILNEQFEFEMFNWCVLFKILRHLKKCVFYVQTVIAYSMFYARRFFN